MLAVPFHDFSVCSTSLSFLHSLFSVAVSFQPFYCSITFRKCLRCSWNPMQCSKCLSYFL